MNIGLLKNMVVRALHEYNPVKECDSQSFT